MTRLIVIGALDFNGTLSKAYGKRVFDKVPFVIRELCKNIG